MNLLILNLLPIYFLLPIISNAKFVHPGMLSTESDFERIRAKIAAKQEPWLSGWNKLLKSRFIGMLPYEPKPTETIYRGGDLDNKKIVTEDIAAAYVHAIYWKITGDESYAESAVKILNAWSTTVKNISGNNDLYLAAGLYGYQFANVAELVRDRADFNLIRFQDMLRHIFYPLSYSKVSVSNSFYWANWDLCSIACIMATGILTNNGTMFQWAVDAYKSPLYKGGLQQYVYYVHPGHLVQVQEAGRDQGHNTLDIALGGVICEMAWNQGVDLYGWLNNRFLAGSEHTAMGNYKQNGEFAKVPYIPFLVPKSKTGAMHYEWSNISQGNVRPEWALVYNHFENRMGISAPWTKKFAKQIEPEGGNHDYGSPGSGAYDLLGYGTLLFSRDPISKGAAPSGLTATMAASNIRLSWFGGVNGSSYSVQRGTQPNGPFETIHSGINGLLTYSEKPNAGIYYYRVISDDTGEASNVAKAVTEKQLHYHLTFDDDEEGTLAADSSGNGAESAKLMNGASWADGFHGRAVKLNRSLGSYVKLPKSIVANIFDFTVAFWAFWDVWPPVIDAGVFDFGSGKLGIAAGRYMAFTANANNNKGHWRFVSTVLGEWAERQIFGDTALSNSTLPTRQWCHVAVTQSDTTLNVFFNATLVGTNSTFYYQPFQLGNTSGNYIGRIQRYEAGNFDGLIDDFRIYNYAMSQQEIEGIMFLGDWVWV